MAQGAGGWWGPRCQSPSSRTEKTAVKGAAAPSVGSFPSAVEHAMKDAETRLPCAKTPVPSRMEAQGARFASPVLICRRSSPWGWDPLSSRRHRVEGCGSALRWLWYVSYKEERQEGAYMPSVSCVEAKK